MAALALRQNIYLSLGKFSRESAIQLLSRSWPLMASSLAVIGYFYIDQIIIAILMDSEAVGIYAAASRVSQQLYVLPTILVAAYYPRLTVMNSCSDSDFTGGFTALSVVLIAASLAACVLVFLFGDELLLLLLGEQFAATGEIFKLHVIGLFFVSLICYWWEMVCDARPPAFVVGSSIVDGGLEYYFKFPVDPNLRVDWVRYWQPWSLCCSLHSVLTSSVLGLVGWQK